MAQTRLITDLWSRTIEAQLDLARMAARSRQLGLAIVGAALIVAAVLAGSGSRAELALGSTTIAIHVSALVLGAAALVLAMLRVLDLDVYERMQRGAASLAEALEKKEPELLEGMSRKVGFAADERARKTYTYVTAAPALLAGLVLIASNARGSAVPAPDAIPASPDATYAAPSLEGAGVEPAAVDPTDAIASSAAVAPTAPAQNQTPATRPAVGKKAAPHAAGAPATGGAAAKPVEDDGIAELEAAAKAASAAKTEPAKAEAAKAEPAKSEAKPEPAKSEAAKSEAAKADPPPAAKSEEPKADPPAPKPEEPKAADPAPPPAQ